MKKKPDELSHEEHEARAMLMGLRYHHGNGDPFYYKPDENGMPEWTSLVDANTLEPMIGHSANRAYNVCTDDKINAVLALKAERIRRK